MLQENSFFLRPLTYFGEYPIVDDEEKEELSLEQMWQISFGGEIDLPKLPQQKIGLFLNWNDLL